MRVGVALLALVVLLVGGTASHANDPPSVEVHIQHGDVLDMFDCWPLDSTKPVPDDVMLVYINYPAGVAGYICDYGGGAWIMPFMPRPENIVISY